MMNHDFKIKNGHLHGVIFFSLGLLLILNNSRDWDQYIAYSLIALGYFLLFLSIMHVFCPHAKKSITTLKKDGLNLSRGCFRKRVYISYSDIIRVDLIRTRYGSDLKIFTWGDRYSFPLSSIENSEEFYDLFRQRIPVDIITDGNKNPYEVFTGKNKSTFSHKGKTYNIFEPHKRKELLKYVGYRNLIFLHSARLYRSGLALFSLLVAWWISSFFHSNLEYIVLLGGMTSFPIVIHSTLSGILSMKISKTLENCEEVTSVQKNDKWRKY